MKTNTIIFFGIAFLLAVSVISTLLTSEEPTDK